MMRDRRVSYPMPVISTNELKQEVLNRAAITKLNHKLFRKLAGLIQERTNKRISVTTLKRVYGVATCKFNISRYTISVLGEYVEAIEWKQAS